MKLKTLLKGSVVLAASLFVAGVVSATTFKVAIGDAAGGTQHELGKAFAASLNKKTDGNVKVDLFPNSQLGDEQDTVNDAAMGLLDFSILAINNVTPFSPSVAVLTLPYVIQSAEEAKQLTLGEVGKELTENTIRDAGVRIVGWSYSGFRVLTNSKRPVKTLADLKGLVIRVPRNELMIATYNSWGLNPSPLAWTETFTALQQQVADGQDNPYITISAMKFEEVQKYVTNIRYLFSLEPLVVSESIFQQQTPELQQAILDAGMEATEHSYAYLAETENRIKDELVAAGMEISDPADDEKEWIEAATAKVWPAFYDAIGGKERLDKILASLGR
ncbi:TRAP transporter substrate-binding protein [Paenalcaligenes niemegkensis]|uniref:TRAP transporter substrate-binding protein n=1 Tax=Paenalcaligenes niemegkensis TaxID=2895469 RepID=UPI001EE7B431|nr:TRAP transporter substrate-binding protein [Paenalcaligenes niemegkensis]MCQ9615713.1 TRAP transporter substrate-binding protein [Paenalcaligenes niemegkensis]